MASDSPAPHSPSEAPRRPKGILKNSQSYQNASPEASVSPTSDRPAPPANDSTADNSGRPPMPNRELSEKEIVQMNTEMNAGNTHRRNSSNPRASVSRRQSGTSMADGTHDEQGMRLKWDEANLYLNEGQMGGKMKIDEPKTPYAKQYDPMEDEAEMSTINPQELAVDELEMDKSKQPSKRSRESEIPGLDLGQPEMDPVTRRQSDGERSVVVESDDMDIDSGTHHGESKEEDMSSEEWAKHQKFEEMRRKHYEMRNVKNLLGHGAEDEDDDDEKIDSGR